MTVREAVVSFINVNEHLYREFIAVDGDEGTTSFDGYLRELSKASHTRALLP
jgi:hypothetical protein